MHKTDADCEEDGMWKIYNKRSSAIPILEALIPILIMVLSPSRSILTFLIVLAMLAVWLFVRFEHNRPDRLKKKGVAIIPEEVLIKHERSRSRRAEGELRVRASCKCVYNAIEFVAISDRYELAPTNDFPVAAPPAVAPDDSEYSAIVYINPRSISDYAVHLTLDCKN